MDDNQNPEEKGVVTEDCPPDRIRQLIQGMSSPMARVLKALRPGQMMTGSELRGAIKIPRRTMYIAIKKLIELELIASRPSLRDTRQTCYWLKVETKEKAKSDESNEPEIPQAVQRKRPALIGIMADPVKPTPTESEPEPAEVVPLSRTAESIWRAIRESQRPLSESQLCESTGLPKQTAKEGLGILIRHSLIEGAYSINDGTTFIYRIRKKAT